jgi:hypothetical protein
MPAPRTFAAEHSRAHRRPAPTSRAALVILPAGGTDLPVPPMPAGRDWTDDERQRWDELWQSPQATQWDESARGLVAVMIVYEGAVLSGTASAWQATELRHAVDALGLSPRSMTAMGWSIQ